MHGKTADRDRKLSNPDPRLDRAREEAEGTEFFGDPFADMALEIEREEAEGVEIFADPYNVVLRLTLKEGSPGHETLTGEELTIGWEQEEDERSPEEAEPP